MSIDDAVVFALDGGVDTSPAIAILTPRERQVVALIARGLSNRQIAEELVVTKHTADRHVSNILGKLGLSARTQVVAWAFEQRSRQGTIPLV
jgi:non-specific serine/threonine protein kinase